MSIKKIIGSVTPLIIYIESLGLAKGSFIYFIFLGFTLAAGGTFLTWQVRKKLGQKTKEKTIFFRNLHLIILTIIFLHFHGENNLEETLTTMIGLLLGLLWAMIFFIDDDDKKSKKRSEGFSEKMKRFLENIQWNLTWKPKPVRVRK